MEAATLAVGCRCLAAGGAHGAHRRTVAAAIAPRPGAKLPRRRVRRLRALPPELSEILAPKLVPGSPADTGDVSALIPISALMLLFYVVTNWAFPAAITKGMEPTAEDEAAAAAEAASMASSSSSSPQGSDAKILSTETNSTHGYVSVRHRISRCSNPYDAEEECTTSKPATGGKDAKAIPSRRNCLACLCGVTLISASGPTLYTPNGLAADMQKAVCRNCGGGGAIIYYSFGYPLDPYVVLSPTAGGASRHGYWVQPFGNDSTGFIQPIWLAV